jgi:hypothetical protein
MRSNPPTREIVSIWPCGQAVRGSLESRTHARFYPGHPHPRRIRPVRPTRPIPHAGCLESRMHARFTIKSRCHVDIKRHLTNAIQGIDLSVDRATGRRRRRENKITCRELTIPNSSPMLECRADRLTCGSGPVNPTRRERDAERLSRSRYALNMLNNVLLGSVVLDGYERSRV